MWNETKIVSVCLSPLPPPPLFVKFMFRPGPCTNGLGRNVSILLIRDAFWLAEAILAPNLSGAISYGQNSMVGLLWTKHGARILATNVLSCRDQIKRVVVYLAAASGKRLRAARLSWTRAHSRSRWTQWLWSVTDLPPAPTAAHNAHCHPICRWHWKIWSWGLGGYRFVTVMCLCDLNHTLDNVWRWKSPVGIKRQNVWTQDWKCSICSILVLVGFLFTFAL